MFCEKCGYELKENEEKCPQCSDVEQQEQLFQTESTPQEDMVQTPLPQKNLWYCENWVTILALIFVWPVGLFLMWRYHEEWDKTLKTVVTILVGMLFLVCINNMSGKEPSGTTTTTKTQTVDTSSKSTTKPVATAKPTSTPKPTPAPTPEPFNPDNYKWGLNYKELARTPDAYKYQKMAFRGEVVQVLEGSATINLRVALGGDYDQMFFVDYDKDLMTSRVLEDDYITMYGTYMGVYSYEATSGATITIPWLHVEQIEIDSI